MARPVTTLAIFFIVFNLWAGIMMSTGFADTIGIDASVGEDDQINEAVEASENVDSGTSTGSTLFGMYNVLAGQVGSVVSTLLPGIRMLQRAGIPNYITQGLLTPLFGVMTGIMVMSFLRGWDL